MFERGYVSRLCLCSLTHCTVYISRHIVTLPCSRKLGGEGCVRALLGTLVLPVASCGDETSSLTMGGHYERVVCA